MLILQVHNLLLFSLYFSAPNVLYVTAFVLELFRFLERKFVIYVYSRETPLIYLKKKKKQISFYFLCLLSPEAWELIENHITFLYCYININVFHDFQYKILPFILFCLNLALNNICNTNDNRDIYFRQHFNCCSWPWPYFLECFIFISMCCCFLSSRSSWIFETLIYVLSPTMCTCIEYAQSVASFDRKIKICL